MADQKPMKDVPISKTKMPDYMETYMKQKKYVEKHLFSCFHSLEIVRPEVRTFYELNDKERILITDKLIHAIHDECSELLNWLPWKHWKNYDDFKLDKTEIKFEIIDLVHFVNELWMIWGKYPNEMPLMYDAKLDENIRRQKDGY